MTGPVRSRRSRSRGAAAFVALGSLVVTFLAASAFACVPQPLVFVGAPGAGQPGDKLTVRAVRFGASPAEVRWNATDGPLLASSSGGDFDTEITIPPAAPGAYVLVVFNRSPDGSVGALAAAPVAVPGAPAPVVASSAGSRNRSSGDGAVWAFPLIGLAALVIGTALALRSRRGRPSRARMPAGVAAP